jgi:hypothetical protein
MRPGRYCKWHLMATSCQAANVSQACEASDAGQCLVEVPICTTVFFLKRSYTAHILYIGLAKLTYVTPEGSDSG